MFSGEGNLVHYCSQEKKTGALLFQEKGSGALLFSGEKNWCSTLLLRTVVHQVPFSCSCFQEKGLVLYCSREKGDGAAVLDGFYRFYLYKN